MRAFVPVTSAIVVVVGWGIVAHNSGAGWVQTLGDVVAGTLFLGLVGPAVALARTTVAVTAAPADASAGRPCEIALRSSSRVRVRPLDPAGPECFVGPTTGADPGPDPVVLLPSRRGVVDVLVADVASSAPFGFLWWTRRTVLSLGTELHIGPRLGSPVDLPGRHDDRVGDTPRRTPRDIGEPRGVRPYRPGDSRRAVHWPATAHSGELMVREMEAPRAEPVEVVVSLPPDDGAAEVVAEQALGTVVALLDRGTAVTLTTREASGRRRAVVTDRRGAGRRLARATAGVPAGTPAGGAVSVVSDGTVIGRSRDAGGTRSGAGPNRGPSRGARSGTAAAGPPS